LSILIKNIKELLQVRDPNIALIKGSAMKVLPTLKNAFVYFDKDSIID